MTQLLQRIDTLERQVEWFRRQLFGTKSERFAPMPDPQQMHLGQVLGQDLPVPASSEGDGQQRVSSHTRRRPRGHPRKHLREVDRERDLVGLHAVLRSGPASLPAPR